MKFPREKISASLINAYNDCPYGWKLTVIDELLPEEGPALQIGSMFDLMFKSYHEGKDPIKEAKKEFLKGNVNKDTINNFGIARNLLEVYLKNPDKFKNPKFDLKFEVPIVDPLTGEQIPGIILKGFLDGLDNNKRIKELKSTTEPYTQDRVNKALQGRIYSYGMYMTLDEILPVDWIVVGKKTNIVNRFTTTYNLNDFHDLFMTIKEFIANVEAEKFNKNPNHPFWCSCRKLSKI